MTDQKIKEMFESYGQYADGHELALVRAIEAVVSPKREWVGLTDEEIKEFETWLDNEEEKIGWNPPPDIVKYLEAKLKQKNGYAEEKNT